VKGVIVNTDTDDCMSCAWNNGSTFRNLGGRVCRVLAVSVHGTLVVRVRDSTSSETTFSRCVNLLLHLIYYLLLARRNRLTAVHLYVVVFTTVFAHLP